jgi:hypothetical protein
VLSDERNVGLFPDDEREAIEAHIPWTRLVAERTTRHGGRKIDLVPFILAQRERLVLKPNDEYGGKGIVLGWEGTRRVGTRFDRSHEPTSHRASRSRASPFPAS